MDLTDRCRALVEELDLGRAEDVRKAEPLTGGVASDIALVDLGGRRLCLKFALPKLKVAADWQAPVHRNAAEYAWLSVANDLCPESAVALFGQSARLNGFAMAYLEGPDVYLWKKALLSGAPDRGEAAKVADLLGRVHGASCERGFERGPFGNREDFHAIRIEPYLIHTARAHPDLAGTMEQVAEQLNRSDHVLVHGDASPKNIMFRAAAPLLLDAECATMGDACFDPAFCLSHLALKAVHLPRSRDGLLGAVRAFWEAYARHVSWEPPDEVEARVCKLLPMLMLARVDGKSPVEYLSGQERETVRAFASSQIKLPVLRIEDFVRQLADELKEYSP